MLATMQDLVVYTEADFYRLPDDGIFEVVNGRAILLPASDIPHQKMSFELATQFSQSFKVSGSRAVVLLAVNVFIPRRPGDIGDLQNRVPDIVVSTHEPPRHFPVGNPPELAIEILSTRRGNVERTEKLDDYALAGIGEYWVVDPFNRAIEVYCLRDGEYLLECVSTSDPLRPAVFPEVEINPLQIWLD